MNSKLVLYILISCLVVAALVSQIMSSQSLENKQGSIIQAERVHNLDTGRNYTSIQAAIDANETLDGHTIFVEEGTYHEHVTVKKSLTLVGENKDTTVIDGDGFGNVINLFQEENVSISGFTIRNSGPTLSDNGILVSYSTNITVYDNIITENMNGLRLISSTNNNISHNSIINNRHRGIDLTTSSYNIISENNLTYNIDGAFLILSHNNTLDANIVSNNRDMGVFFDHSHNNTLSDNMVSNNNGFGIGLRTSFENTLQSNIMTGNTHNFGIDFHGLEGCFNNVDVSNLVDGKPIYYWINKQGDEVPLDAGYVALVNCSNITVNNLALENNSQGILLANTNNSLITHNTMMKNTHGITLTLSHNNTISSNTIANNQYYGIFLFESSNSTIITNDVINNDAGIFLDHSNNNVVFHNNFVDNAQKTYSHVSTNVWDNGFEGSFWSNYNGTDANHDGIGDTIYVIDANNKDNYPLMGMFSTFNTSLGYYVNVISNSTVGSLEYFESNSTIKMYISNMTSNQAYGFCKTCIPKSLIAPQYCVTINDGSVEVLYFNDTIYDNGTHRWICFSYEHSILKIVIVPEFPLFIILPLFMMSTLLAVLIYNTQTKRRLR